jgi:hypothetical protein
MFSQASPRSAKPSRRAGDPIRRIDNSPTSGEPDERGRSRIPADSVLYRRVLPAVLVVLALLTLALIVIAAGVLLRLIPWT